ncbi:MAG: RsiV family protein [Beduini sp.]|uniref:RsiV family protein n=1 Tax=Beduini sp. TaxID=1922300 RepID=UPI0011C7587B
MKKIRDVLLASTLVMSLLWQSAGIYAAAPEEEIMKDEVQFVTISNDTYHLYGAEINVVIKHIEHVENKEVEKRINALIDQSIEDILTKQEQELKDVYQENHQIHTEIGLNLSDYYVDDNLVSFSIDFLQIMASSFQEKTYHTIDLKTGDDYKLEHWLGKDYAAMVKNEVVRQIDLQNKENGSDLYFMDEVNKLTILPDQSYYINKDGQVVVTFPKYQIAPGYLGLPEFIMPINIKEVTVK